MGSGGNWPIILRIIGKNTHPPTNPLPNWDVDSVAVEMCIIKLLKQTRMAPSGEQRHSKYSHAEILRSGFSLLNSHLIISCNI